MMPHGHLPEVAFCPALKEDPPFPIVGAQGGFGFREGAQCQFLLTVPFPIPANEVAENAGVKVVRIRTARQGAFEMRDVGSSRGDTRSLERDVRVVITVDFYLTD